MSNIDRIKQVMEDVNFSGIISIRHNGQVVFQASHGYADWANKRLIDDQTRFGIASGTKFLTALGIMRLVEIGKCQLDDSIFKYIQKSFSAYDQEITLRHLLSHMSGIPDYYDKDRVGKYGETYLEKPWYAFKNPRDYLDIIPDKQGAFEPGYGFDYNNTGFVLLAFIIERLTGDYHRWIQDQVLEPAGMTASGAFHLNALPQNTAIGYIHISQGNYQTNQYALPLTSGGDRGYFSTIDDIIKLWQSFFMGHIINKDLVREMLKVHYEDDHYCHGLGLWLEKRDTRYIPCMIGGDSGVSFRSVYNPLEDFTYVILSNTQKGASKVFEKLKKIGILN